MDNFFNDRRRSKRSTATLNVYLRGEVWTAKGTATNISRRGAWVTTAREGYMLGTRVIVVFVQSKMKNVIEMRTYSAIVVRQGEEGIAIQFCWSPQTERITGGTEGLREKG